MMNIEARRPYFQLSYRQKLRNNEKIKEALKTFERNALLGMNFKLHSVQITNINNQNENYFLFELQENYEPRRNNIKVFTKIKDDLNISDKGFAHLSRNLEEAPTLYQIKKDQERLNMIFKNYIKSNEKGYYIDVKFKIKFILTYLLREIVTENNIIKIKYCADSTNIGRNIKILNLNFTCLNDKNCKASRGNYCLGMFRISKESYEECYESLNEVFNEINELNQIEINDRVYKIDKYFTGDLHLSAILKGINAANAIFPCVWCKCPQKTADINKEWSIVDANKGARSDEDARELLTKHTIQDRKGYTKIPILGCIEFSKVIVDHFHLFLRISDKLEELLVKKINLLDAPYLINDSDRLDINKQIFLKRYIDFMENEVQISTPCVMDQKKLKPRSLTGKEKRRLFSKLNVDALFPELAKSKEINQIWQEFFKIYNDVRTNSLTHDAIKDLTMQWLKIYVQIFTQAEITPYIHIFVHHLYEFVQLYGNVNDFNLQGLEKYNDRTKQDYMQATNKHRKKDLLTLIKKRNRIDFSKFESYFNGQELNDMNQNNN